MDNIKKYFFVFVGSVPDHVLRQSGWKCTDPVKNMSLFYYMILFSLVTNY